LSENRVSKKTSPCFLAASVDMLALALVLIALRMSTVRQKELFNWSCDWLCNGEQIVSKVTVYALMVRTRVFSSIVERDISKW
jgi:hypothetical protein